MYLFNIINTHISRDSCKPSAHKEDELHTSLGGQRTRQVIYSLLRCSGNDENVQFYTISFFITSVMWRPAFVCLSVC